MIVNIYYCFMYKNKHKKYNKYNKVISESTDDELNAENVQLKQ